MLTNRQLLKEAAFVEKSYTTMAVKEDYFLF